MKDRELAAKRAELFDNVNQLEYRQFHLGFDLNRQVEIMDTLNEIQRIGKPKGVWPYLDDTIKEEA